MVFTENEGYQSNRLVDTEHSQHAHLCRKWSRGESTTLSSAAKLIIIFKPVQNSYEEDAVMFFL
jgi:hypothetical protein